MENQEDKEQPGQLERISMKMIWRSILQEFNLERGILFTVFALAIRPGQTLREYLYQDRTRLIPPLRFLIVFVTLATIATLSFLTQEDFFNAFKQGVETGGGSVDFEKMSPKGREFMNLYINNATVANLKFFNIYLMLSVPLAALGTLIVYRLRQFNFAEHLVINCYIYSNTTVLYVLLTPLFFIFSYQAVSIWYMVAALPYYCFCCYQVFQPKGWKAILKSVLAFVLQGIFAMLLAFILSIGIAVITALWGIKMEIG